MRALLFLLVFALVLLASAPLERWVLPVIQPRLEAANLRVDLASLRLAAPAGLEARQLTLAGPEGDVRVDRLYVGLPHNLQAEACEGRLDGSFGTDSLAISFSGFNPSRCVRVGKLEVDAALDGEVALSGLAAALHDNLAGTSASVRLESTGGTFRGVLEHAGPGGQDLPLGEWDFRDVSLSAKLEGGRVRIERGTANTSGVQWELLALGIPTVANHGALRIDFRARVAEDGPRARALLGLLPRSTEGAGGWHHYRVSGSLSALRLVGIE